MVSDRPEIAVLFISYDGGLGNLAQSQIWPYLIENSRRRIRFHAVTFEKPLSHPSQGETLRELDTRLSLFGIRWTHTAFRTGGFVAKIVDLVCGLRIVAGINFREAIQVIHARSYVAGFLALLLKLCSGRRFILDLRGFWVDERVESGLWRKGGARYRIWKFLETRMLKKADLIITLTHASSCFLRDAGYDGNRIMVIPTCVDTDRFQPAKTRRFAGEIRLIYAGSIGTWYMLDEMIRFFSLLRARRRSQFLLIVPDGHGFVKERLAHYGIGESEYRIRRSSHQDMPRHLGEADAGIAFYRPGFSRLACCPTKIGEYLSCGLPFVINRGIGDCDELVEGNQVGVLVRGFSQAELSRGVDALLTLLEDGGVRERCRALGEKKFQVRSGAESYYQAYTRMMGWI